MALLKSFLDMDYTGFTEFHGKIFLKIRVCPCNPSNPRTYETISRGYYSRNTPASWLSPKQIYSANIERI